MTGFKQLIIGGLALIASVAAVPAFAADVTHSTPGISGYDPVAYFTDGKPVRGSGYHVTTHEGVTYVFANADHKKLFIANPKQYHCGFKVLVQHPYPGASRNEGVAHGSLPTPDSYGA